MKRYIIISILSISTIILLGLRIIPHHHHAGIACIIMELCENDDRYNDEHTHHEELPEQTNHDNSCITEIDVIIPSSDNEILIKILLGKNDLNHNLLFFLPTVLLSQISDTENSDTDYGEFIINYQSVKVNRYNGLRAPPYLLA